MQESSLPKFKRCPYLGLKEDRDSALGYASAGNRCYNCQPVSVPALTHQAEYCLADLHEKCPIFKSDSRNIKGHLLRQVMVKRRIAGRSGGRFFLLGGVLVSLFLLSWQINPPPFPGESEMVWPSLSWPSFFFFTGATPVSQQMPVIRLTATPISMVSATGTPTAAPRALPTFEINPESAHALDIPIPAGDRKYIIHIVRPAEGYELLSSLYDTTPDVIRALNYFFHQEIVWAGFPVVVSPGLKTVSMDQPAFEVYRVVDKEISAELLAKELNVDESSLRFYNSCPKGCMLTARDWLIVPRNRIESRLNGRH